MLGLNLALKYHKTNGNLLREKKMCVHMKLQKM